MRAPAVSVVVATRAAPVTLAAALSSVARQDLADVAAEVEVVLVLDAGRSVAPPLLAAAGGVPVRRIEAPRRGGLSAARSAGIASARGEYVAFLDDDDLWLPGHLSAALDGLGGDVDMVFTTTVVAATRHDPGAGEPVAGVHVFDFPYDGELLAVANTIPVIAAVSRRFPVDAGYDCGAAQDDWEMWLRLTRRHGWRLRHVDRATAVYHRLTGAPSMTGQAATTVEGIRRFAAGHRLLHRRWPVTPGGPADRARSLPLEMYRRVEERLATGRPVSHYYYERSLPVFTAAVDGRLTTAEASDLLTAAVDPAHGPADTMATARTRGATR